MERRKQVRPTLRRDLRIVPQQHEGRRCYVVKDPVTLQYYRFQEAEHFILRHLDGGHTVDDIQREFERQFRPRRLRLDEVETFARELVNGGLAGVDRETATDNLLRHRRRRQRRERLTWWSNPLCIQFPLCDPDRFLSAMLRRLPGLVSGTCFLAGLGLVLAALALVATHFEAFCARLPGQQEFFTLENIGYFWLALGMAKVCHELGHGLTCKAFGGEVHELGVMFLCFSPCLYCDVSDAWTLPGKWRRILISLAGIYVELVIAALATFVWWNAAAQPFLQHLCLGLMVVCSVGTLAFNANPLLRYDGYYALADWLELPNLHTQARRSLFACLGACMFGFRGSQRWRGWLAAFGLASFVYRWIVTIAVLWMLCRFLKPYRLESLGLFAAMGSISFMLIWPASQLVCVVGEGRRRWEAMNYRRTCVSLGLLALLTTALFLVPLPVGRIRQTGVLQLPPDGQESVYVHVPGILQRLHVRNGQRVVAGELLAEFRSPELDNLRAAAAAERDVQAVQAGRWRERLAGALDPVDRSVFGARLANALAERPRLAREAQLHEHMCERLRIRAPRDGVVFGLPTIDEIGKYWNIDARRPLCRIGTVDKLWVVVPLETADFRRLREDFEDARKAGNDLPAAIRVPGRGGRTWPGCIAQLPEAETIDLPMALGQRAGGPVAAKPSGDVLQPLSQHYLVAVQVIGPDAAVCPGGLASVSIRGRWRTPAECLWRMLASVFDLGFLT